MWNSLRIQLTLILTGLVVVPLIVVGAILTQRSFATEEEQSLNLQEQVSVRVAAEVETFIQEIEADISSLASEFRNFEELDRAQQISILLNKLSSGSNQNVYEGFSLLDEQGQELIRLSRSGVVSTDELADLSEAEVFTQTIDSQQIYYSPIRFDDVTGQLFMDIAIPLTRPRSVELIGILVVDLRFNTVGDFMVGLEIAEDQTVYIIDSEGRIVAHPDSSISAQGTVIELPSDDVRTNGLNGVDVLFARSNLQLGNQEFGVVAERSYSEALSSAYTTIYVIGIVTGISLLMAVVLAVLAARRIAKPIKQLSVTAQAIDDGDLSRRVIQIKRRDEIGQLGVIFNNMADQIQNLVGTLEDRIVESTRNLQAVVDVNTQITTILDVERLLRAVSNLTKDRFGLYHAHIYLLNEVGDTLTLAAGAGYVGRQMVGEGRSISFYDQKSIVAQAANSRSTVVINDTGNSLYFLPNPLLPETRSELAVALISRGQLLGVLDVQSDQVGFFDQTNQAIIETLAGQVSNAISNTRLYENAIKTSRHDQVLSSITESVQNANTVDDILQTAIKELGKALRVPHTAIELQLATETEVQERDNGFEADETE